MAVVLASKKTAVSSLAALTVGLCVFMTVAVLALLMSWLIGAELVFYVVLTAVLAPAAGVNIWMVAQRLTKLKDDLTRVEFWSATMLEGLTALALGTVLGICFSIGERPTTYPVIFSMVPVIVLFLNGYVTYIETRVAQRRAAQPFSDPADQASAQQAQPGS
jgi:peptidoglycan/LPS O-acetylase OafA/YrhL